MECAIRFDDQNFQVFRVNGKDPWFRRYDDFSTPYLSLDDSFPLQLITRDSLEELMHKMSDRKYNWMKARISRLWSDWREAAKALEREKPAFRNRQVKDVSLMNVI